MKKRNYILPLSFILIFAGLLITGSESFAQKKESTRVRAYYEKLPSQNKQIKIILTAGKGKNLQGVANADIKLTSTAGEEKMKLATIQTNMDGEGFLEIEPGFDLPTNEEGQAIISAAFSGNDTLKASKRSVKFLDLTLDSEFNIVDSVKTISITALRDSLGVKLPVDETEVEVGVKRMHSVLFLETVETDKNGLAEFEFPDDIPGDQDGKLTIVLRVLEDRAFGTVSTRSDINWGTIVDYSITGNGRSLFGDEAPLWMIIATLVVLSIAWFHFIWAIIKVYSIKKLANTDQS